MQTITARNVHQALPRGIELLQQFGRERASRAGPVLVAPWPVVTEYLRPMERCIFWPVRDFNPAFVVYEALWMLAGRRDLAPLLRYVKDFGKFSDDGVIVHGAYGHRWREAFGMDQLRVIAKRLREDPGDRRAVLQMWDAARDLGHNGKDVPCNDLVTFQLRPDGPLDMTVFCRSNDIIWGAYYANAFHFSVLLEYMAAWIGVAPGTYYQVSVNWHAYLDVLKPLEALPRAAFNHLFSVPQAPADPYAAGEVQPVQWFDPADRFDHDARYTDRMIKAVLREADTGFPVAVVDPVLTTDGMRAAYAVLRAHYEYDRFAAPERYAQALQALDGAPPAADIVVAMRRWIERRAQRWEERMTRTRPSAAQDLGFGPGVPPVWG